MALVKNAGKETGKDVDKVDAQKQKIAEAQAKIEKDREAGATAGSAAPEKEKVTPEAELMDDAIPEDTAVVVKAPAGELAAPAGRVTKIFADRKDIMVAPFGTFPRIKTGSGVFKDGEGSNYGTWFDFEILSYNFIYIITPNNGKQDDDEAKAALRYSYDGVTIESTGELVADYIKKLVADGYEKAVSKKYCEVVGMLLDCDKKASVEDSLNQMVQLQLAPTSLAKFEGYIMSSSFHVARGTITEDQASLVRVKAKDASGGGNEWTNFTFTTLPSA